MPPVIAIVLALITKEVYSSLFIGILFGGLIYSNFSFEGTIVHVFSDGFVSIAADCYNVGIIIFLVLLGAMVSMMNKAGGSAAFGRWASKHIKTKVGAQCKHINHVSTQLPYALTVAGVSFVCYLLAGFIPNWLLVLPIGIVLMLGTLFAIKFLNSKKSV